MKKAILFFSLFTITSSLVAQSNNPPGLSLIRSEDLKKDLYRFASAHFKGRSAGTIDELNASAWLVEQFRAIGLKPAGDNGTYLQFFSLVRKQLANNSTIEINGTPLQLWKDVAVSQLANTNLKAPIVYLGNAADIDTNTVDVKDKVIAIEASTKGINLNVSLPTWRYNRYIFARYGMPLLKRGAKAILFIADEQAEAAWADATENFKRGIYDLHEEANPNASARSAQSATATAPVIWLHAEAKQKLQNNTASINMNLIVSEYLYPSANVVGMVEGTDPKLKSEYVLYSGHTDAHGIRNVIKGDSIYYGADDNGSVDVAMLANARAFAKYPSKRSVLFVIHGAEERGLFGSRYYSGHPTVPVGKIVAVLNGDMIGRNNTDSAAILGVNPPHRNSSDLVSMALAANKEGPNFKLDTTWDNINHVEGWYFRSDHLPYARLGIPAIMYTSLLHPDYHTPQDNVESINYPKLKKMADWMYRTGWKVANKEMRPATDKDFKLER
ncbi:M28 family metallopeptidase [Flavisolibacter tropicus]|uniref:Peptidase M28 n=1 Tax=Flavisolibacter tropicus TaxID=1492898 RepID=A0A172TTJ2_9BACT|nr:M28 family peptidase [Flavisolibacter tropicus]ANE50409.1 peptidase M28 [Flavisolibacter tropicus]